MTLLLWLVAFQAQAADYNPIYRGELGAIVSGRPNVLLVESIRSRKPGKALDVGMGQGRNTIYLAQQGWDVTGLDPADEGVRIAKAEAARIGLKIRAEVTTFEEFDFGENQWDLIVLTYEPTKAIAPKVTGALKPGGVVVVEDRHLDVMKMSGRAPTGGPKTWVRLLAEKPIPAEPGCSWKAKPVLVGASVCWDTAVLRCRPDGWQFTQENCIP